MQHLCGNGSTLYQNIKILDLSKLKAFADEKIKVNKKFKISFVKDGNLCGKRRKYWLPAFSPFSAMFSKAFSFRVIKSWVMC